MEVGAVRDVRQPLGAILRVVTRKIEISETTAFRLQFREQVVCIPIDISFGSDILLEATKLWPLRLT